MFTISELAQAVGKTENYVRQHVYRGHLAARKKQGRTYVTEEEALRWSRARGLPLARADFAMSVPGHGQRAARLTVAAHRRADGTLVNAFTLLRLRRTDLLGPWAPDPGGRWRREDLGGAFELFTLDADPDRGEALVAAVLDSGTMDLGDRLCHYDLHGSPRSYWTYRNYRADSDAPITSPFSTHSAEVREHWARDGDARRSSVAALDALPADVPALAPLGFPLRDRPDRLGNVVVASAWDPITCTLSARRGRGTLALDVAGDPLPGEYGATVWAANSGDVFLHRRLPVDPGTLTIALPVAPDRIGFEVFRASDGQCVDRMDADLVVAVDVRVAVAAGPALELTDRRGGTLHTVAPARSRSRIVVTGDDDASTVDQVVRTRSLGRLASQAENAARRDGRLARFGPGSFADAVAHLVKLLDEDADRTDPVYLADRYFLKEVSDVQGVRLYSDLLVASAGRELRVLCAQRPRNHRRPWWKRLPGGLAGHLAVRSFLTRQPEPQAAFHDRYVITPTRETLLSHSFAGWARDGVTFVTLPFGVYRAQAEYLWSMQPGSPDTPFLVEEYA